MAKIYYNPDEDELVPVRPNHTSQQPQAARQTQAAWPPQTARPAQASRPSYTPRPTQTVRQKRRRIREGSALDCLVTCLLIIGLNAAALALILQLFYEWIVRMYLWGLWCVLIMVVIVLYGTFMMMIIKPDYIII